MTTVNYTPDPKKKPQLTEEQEAKLAMLSDEDIDYSDIEELDDDFWNNATPVTNDLLSELSPSDKYIEEITDSYIEEMIADLSLFQQRWKKAGASNFWVLCKTASQLVQISLAIFLISWQNFLFKEK